MGRSAMGRSVRSGKSNKAEIEAKYAARKAERQVAARQLRARMQRYSFDPSSHRLMLLAFVLNTQVIGQLMLTFNCSRVEVLSGSSSPTFEQGFNFYDSSVSCAPAEIYSSASFAFAVLYVISWTILAPIYVLHRAGREFAIDAVGLGVKVVMLGLAIYGPFISELQTSVLGAFMMAF